MSSASGLQDLLGSHGMGDCAIWHKSATGFV